MFSIENKEEENIPLNLLLSNLKINNIHLIILIVLINVTFVEMSLLTHCLSDIAPKVLSSVFIRSLLLFHSKHITLFTTTGKCIFFIEFNQFFASASKMEPCELEFIGENETIGIIPNFTQDNAIHLISGSIGPFRAGLPVHGWYQFCFE